MAGKSLDCLKQLVKLHPQLRNRYDCYYLASFLPFIYSKPLTYEVVLPTFKVALPPLIYLLYKLSQTCSVVWFKQDWKSHQDDSQD